MALGIGLNKEKIPSASTDGPLDLLSQQYFKMNNLIPIPSLQKNIYPPFKKWLESDKEVTIEGALQDVYDNLFPLLEYDKTKDLLNSEIEVKKNKVIFKHLYNYNDFSINWGECSELSHKLALLVKEKYPALNLVAYRGLDDKFFSREGANHVFTILNGKLGSNFVVDPTYKKIERQEYINYKIRSITNPILLSQFIPKDSVNDFGDSIPIKILEKENTLLSVIIFDNDAQKLLNDEIGLGKHIGLAIRNGNEEIDRGYRISKMNLLKSQIEDQKTLEFIDKFVKRIQNIKASFAI